MKGLISDVRGEVTGILLAVVIIAAVFTIFSAFAAMWKALLAFRYVRLSRKKVKCGLTGRQTAEQMLKSLGIDDVRVEKCGFFEAWFLGNGYSPFKKKIRLRRNICDKSSLAAVAIATQKVAIAKRDHDGDKKIKTRSVFMGFCYFTPFAVLPLILIGLLLDYVAYQKIGVLTFVFSVISAVIYLAAFIVLLLNLPVERKACKTALEFIEKTNVLVDNEAHSAKALYRTYIVNYVLDFISEILFIIWRVIQLIGRILMLKNLKQGKSSN